MIKTMSELNFLLSQLDLLESKYGYMNLQWKIATKNNCIAVLSRPLSSEERARIEIGTNSELSTCNSYSKVSMFQDQICIECTHDDTILIPISTLQDRILGYIPPILFSKRMIGDTFFL